MIFDYRTLKVQLNFIHPALNHIGEIDINLQIIWQNRSSVVEVICSGNLSSLNDQHIPFPNTTWLLTYYHQLMQRKLHWSVFFYLNYKKNSNKHNKKIKKHHKKLLFKSQTLSKNCRGRIKLIGTAIKDKQMLYLPHIFSSVLSIKVFTNSRFQYLISVPSHEKTLKIMNERMPQVGPWGVNMTYKYNKTLPHTLIQIHLILPSKSTHKDYKILNQDQKHSDAQTSCYGRSKRDLAYEYGYWRKHRQLTDPQGLRRQKKNQFA